MRGPQKDFWSFSPGHTEPQHNLWSWPMLCPGPCAIWGQDHRMPSPPPRLPFSSLPVGPESCAVSSSPLKAFWSLWNAFKFSIFVGKPEVMFNVSNALCPWRSHKVFGGPEDAAWGCPRPKKGSRGQVCSGEICTTVPPPQTSQYFTQGIPPSPPGTHRNE